MYPIKSDIKNVFLLLRCFIIAPFPQPPEGSNGPNNSKDGIIPLYACFFITFKENNFYRSQSWI